MRHFLVTFVASLVLTSAANAADGKKVSIRWHGQSFFEIKTSAGTRIVLDPHAIEAYGRHDVEADLILISHLHNDHTQVGVITNFKPTNLRLGLKEPKGDVKRAEWNQIDEQIKDVHIKTVGVYHDAMEGMQRGKNAVFIIEVDGIRIAHLGDLGHLLSASAVKKIGPIDVLLIPVGGVYTINGAEAKKVVEQLKPKQFIVPMHYGTKVYEDLLPVDEFLDEQKKEYVRKYESNELIVEAGANPPEPTIVVLNWKSKK